MTHPWRGKRVVPESRKEQNKRHQKAYRSIPWVKKKKLEATRNWWAEQRKRYPLACLLYAQLKTIVRAERKNSESTSKT